MDPELDTSYLAPVYSSVDVEFLATVEESPLEYWSNVCHSRLASLSLGGRKRMIEHLLFESRPSPPSLTSFLPSLASLQALHFSQMTLPTAWLRRLNAATFDLQTLSLNDCKLRRRGQKQVRCFIAQQTSLQYLRLDWLVDFPMRQLFEAITPNNQLLEISCRGSTWLRPRAMAVMERAMEYCTCLKTFDLSHSLYAKPAYARSLGHLIGRALSKATSLINLNVSGSPGKMAGLCLYVLQGLYRHPLEALDVSKTRWDTELATQLANFTTLCTLKVNNMSRDQDRDWFAFHKLTRLQNLTSLTCNNNGISYYPYNIGVKYLERCKIHDIVDETLAHLTNLAELKLILPWESNQLSFKWRKIVSKLPQLQTFVFSTYSPSREDSPIELPSTLTRLELHEVRSALSQNMKVLEPLPSSLRELTLSHHVTYHAWDTLPQLMALTLGDKNEPLELPQLVSLSQTHKLVSLGQLQHVHIRKQDDYLRELLELDVNMQLTSIQLPQHTQSPKLIYQLIRKHTALTKLEVPDMIPPDSAHILANNMKRAMTLEGMHYIPDMWSEDVGDKTFWSTPTLHICHQ